MATRFKEKTRYTYEDYMKTPDDVRYELIDGDLLMSPAPNIRHQIISGNINALIRSYVKDKELGTVFYAPCDVVLGDENVFEPDILFISKQNSGIIADANIKGAPDLIVEILSPSTADRDLINKKRIYAKYGVKEYWIADPQEKTVELFILNNEQFDLKKSYAQDDVIESVILQGLRIPLKEIF
ncbi:MAG: Uma2 family endonuclease [Nitrospirae bacterium]|nr:Uma2 family endonuclease [Nitrospirota bacterium]